MDFESKTAEELVRWTFQEHGERASISCSFGAEDVVLVDMAYKQGVKFRVFTLDTGRLPQETYDVMEEVRRKYGINVEVYFPDRERVEEMVRRFGPNLFYRGVELRKFCCRVRKVEPLARALNGLTAWVTGLRREQSETRAAVAKVEVDQAHGGILKVNPLADWTWEMVWDYIRSNGVPYNKLHDRGYPSIGCAPCTRAVRPGEPLRAGRWWWEEDKKECGMHF
jgi:phosophoadenylyl-sulfate reductase (thioredoxin)/thioredoxin-dependent adenylylsulfate APS reductase